MDNLGEGLRKLLLAGIGAAATTGEKAQEILDDLVKKGELTMEQRKSLGKEIKFDDLKAKAKQTADSVIDSAKKAGDRVRGDGDGVDLKDISDKVRNMTKDQLAQLRTAIDKIQKNPDEVKGKAEELIKEAGEKAEDVADAVREKAEAFVKEAGEKAEDLKDAAEDKINDLKDAAEDKADDVQDAAQEACDKAEDAVQEACGAAEEKADEVSSGADGDENA